MTFNMVRDDIVHAVADAVVLPSNCQLRIDGGAGLQVAKLAGLERVQRDCDKVGGCSVGSACVTPAYVFPALYLVHAVGPAWVDGESGESQLLFDAYISAFNCAADLGCGSIATPLLSAGSSGFPDAVALSVALDAVRSFLEERDLDIALYLNDDQACAAGRRVMGTLDAYIDERYAQELIPGRRFARSRIGEGRSAADQLGEGVFGVGQLDEEALAPLSCEDDFAAHEEAPLAELTGSLAYAAASMSVVPASAHALICSACGQELPDGARYCHLCGAKAAHAAKRDLTDLLDGLDAPFSPTLLRLIDERGMTDAQVYRRANVSRQLFSKIRANDDYRPTKKTALALCIALELGLIETEDLLARAGYSLSHASKFDVIVEYFITSENYDIFEINETLFAYDQPLLG